MKKRGTKPEIEAVVQLSHEESVRITEMAEAPGDDPRGEAYLRWMNAEAKRARGERPRAV
jgi:hypothetical protein